MTHLRRASIAVVVAGCAALAVRAQQPAGQQGRSTNLGTDPNGNPIRLALKTGHVSNYDEAKVPPYTLPDPLVFADGRRVADARSWLRERRPELVRLYETEIYGRVPASAPHVTWDVTETDAHARDGRALMKQVVGRIGQAQGGPRINLTMYTPANAAKPVPMILIVNFGGGAGPSSARGRPGAPLPLGDPPVAAEILGRGWGYATIRYQDIQADRAGGWTDGVIGMTFESGQQEPRADEWGTISAWAWGISRVLDYFETDKSVNAKRVAVQGHSRLGKTVLWASATDERIAAVFSSCAGEMGSALARRDWGETVDDMAQNFPWQFAGNFQKWVGRWNDMPVDAHILIALSAPRPVFVTGGTADQWADPVGEFKALVAAGPVYGLLAERGLGVSTLPPLDIPVIDGALGWHYHTGPHAATPADWAAFLRFLGRYFS